MNITRTGIILKPDASRVLFRPFNPVGEGRPLRLLARILSLSEAETVQMLTQVLAEFKTRHQRLHDYFLVRFDSIRHLLPTDQPLSEERKLLIGAYFTHEYSLEAAALFNPSIIPHPDQDGIPVGSLRFILSLRATGEGHISSITFRTGVIDEKGRISVDHPSRYVTTPDHIPPTSYDKAIFWRQLQELGVADAIAETILKTLGEGFTVEELSQEIQYLRRYAQHRNSEFDRTASRLVNLAKSNYEVVYSADQPLTERVIFPTAPNESNGIEDARFVRFQDDDRAVTYIATYTAYDGRVTIPQLLETSDFLRFRVCTLNGPEVQNKGMALFPRRIRGQYVMLSRQDAENVSHVLGRSSLLAHQGTAPQANF